MRRVWKIVGYLSSGVAVLGLAGVFYYSIHYGNHNPTTADPSTGHIHPYNYHGTVVYLNGNELMRIHLAEGALYIGVLGALVIYGRVYGFRKR
jgi:hypothetical protein